MPIEQRVITGPKIGAKAGAGSKSGAADNAAPAVEEAPKKRLKPLALVVILLVVALAAGAAYWFLLKPPAAPVAEPAPEPGAVVTVEPISVNLAEGHYLRLGFALQLTAEVTEEPDTAHAVDTAIALFSGRSVAEIADPATRDALKAEFAAHLAEAYEGEVMDVYLTNYVTQ